MEVLANFGRDGNRVREVGAGGAVLIGDGGQVAIRAVRKAQGAEGGIFCIGYGCLGGNGSVSDLGKQSCRGIIGQEGLARGIVGDGGNAAVSIITDVGVVVIGIADVDQAACTVKLEGVSVQILNNRSREFNIAEGKPCALGIGNTAVCLLGKDVLLPLLVAIDGKDVALRHFCQRLRQAQMPAVSVRIDGGRLLICLSRVRAVDVREREGHAYSLECDIGMHVVHRSRVQVDGRASGSAVCKASLHRTGGKEGGGGVGDLQARTACGCTLCPKEHAMAGAYRARRKNGKAKRSLPLGIAFADGFCQIKTKLISKGATVCKHGTRVAGADGTACTADGGRIKVAFLDQHNAVILTATGAGAVCHSQDECCVFHHAVLNIGQGELHVALVGCVFCAISDSEVVGVGRGGCITDQNGLCLQKAAFCGVGGGGADGGHFSALPIEIRGSGGFLPHILKGDSVICLGGCQHELLLAACHGKFGHFGGAVRSAL